MLVVMTVCGSLNAALSLFVMEISVKTWNQYLECHGLGCNSLAQYSNMVWWGYGFESQAWVQIPHKVENIVVDRWADAIDA